MEKKLRLPSALKQALAIPVKTKNIGTPYDNGFRTIIEKCPRLLIPVVNEMFGTDYGMDADLVPLANEFFMLGRSGNANKVVTDTYVRINGNPYHIECQSANDGTMVIRMFEYDVQIGMSEARGKLVNGTEYHIRFPDSGVMYLRTQAENVAAQKIVLETPGGTVSYEIPTLKATTYSLEKIFEKKLVFLIPFYLFSLEPELADIENDKEKLQQLSKTYERILEKLVEMGEEKIFTSFEVNVICDVTNYITQNLARNQNNVKERIGAIMGGQVLKLRSVQIYDEGITKGTKLGIKQGIALEKEESVRTSIGIYRDFGCDVKETTKQIAKRHKISLKDAKEYVKKYW